MKQVCALMAAAAVVSGCALMSPTTPIAVAELKPTQGNKVAGVTTFTQKDKNVVVDARITGLTPGLHGFHLHEKGDCSAPDGSSAGGHFNPTQHLHGNVTDPDHHAGDLGNLTADAEGKATLVLTLPGDALSLKPGAPNSIIGRGLIVHADADDLKTQPAGNSGKRLACAVIQKQ